MSSRWPLQRRKSSKIARNQPLNKEEEEEEEDKDPFKDNKRYDRYAVYEDELDKLNFENSEDDEEIEESAAFGNLEEYEAVKHLFKSESHLNRTPRTDSDSDEGERDNTESEQDEDDDDDDVYVNLSDVIIPKDSSSSSLLTMKHSMMIDNITKLSKPVTDKLTEQKKVIQESVKEGEFALNAASKLNINDLLQNIDDNPDYHMLKQQMEKIDDKISQVNHIPKTKKDKELRQAQYEETVANITKWEPVVDQMQKAAQLVFPLSQPKPTPITISAVTKNFTQETSLEKEISSVLNEGKAENVIKEMEDLQARELTKEDIAARDAQIAKMRHLMYYKERKLHLHKKIKSKRSSYIEKTKREI